MCATRATWSGAHRITPGGAQSCRGAKLESSVVKRDSNAIRRRAQRASCRRGAAAISRGLHLTVENALASGRASDAGRGRIIYFALSPERESETRRSRLAARRRRTYGFTAVCGAPILWRSDGDARWPKTRRR
eukprot:3745036-Prymnesium_polylepis.1